MQDVLRVTADTAQNAENRLDQKWGFDEAAINEMCSGIEMPNVIAFDFKTGTVLTA